MATEIETKLIPLVVALIPFTLFNVPAAIIAASKGFKPWRWLFGLSLIGLVIVCVLQSAKAQGLSADESASRSGHANMIGAGALAFSLALVVFSLLIRLGAR